MSLIVKLHRFKILKCKSEKYARFEFRGKCKFTPLPHQQGDYLIVNKRFEWTFAEPVCRGEVLTLHLLSRSRWGSEVIVGVYRLGLHVLVNDGHLSVTDSLVDDSNKPVMYLHYVYSYGIITTRCPKGADLREIAIKIYPYFIAKHLDLLDTVFFILRKKFNQISFLHVWHHTTMVVWAWLYYLHHPSDNLVIVGLLNSFVHIVMYTYYGLAALGPRYSKYLWWKEHLTKIQLIQFILVLLNMYYQQKLSPCPSPSFFYYYGMFVIISYFVLFMQFYVNSYFINVKKKPFVENKNIR